jgi:hypothetical protein
MKISSAFILTINRAVALVVACGLSACGSNVNNLGFVSNPSTTGVVGAISDGVFRDSSVSGLKYSSVDQSGITGAGGAFKYVVGEQMTFSAGAISLGTIGGGNTIITPLDLVPNSTISTTKVLNIARFLMLLDNDGIPGNGIIITESTQGLAQTWPQIDFTGDLAQQLNTVYDPNTGATILSDLGSTNESHILPSAGTSITDPTPNNAMVHLETMLVCMYSGAFAGTFTGADTGSVALYIDPITGKAEGFAEGSNLTILPLTSVTPLRFDQAPLPAVTVAAANGLYTFQFASLDTLSGNWTDTQGNPLGTFTAARGASDTKTSSVRFAGSFEKTDDTDGGVFAFAINKTVTANNIGIAGEIFSLSTQASDILSGNINIAGINGGASVLTAQSSSNTQINAVINLDSSSPDYLSVTNGTYSVVIDPSQPAVVAGTLHGQGCSAP